MFKKFYLFTITLIFACNCTVALAQTGAVSVSGHVLPKDITNLTAVDVVLGSGEVALTWTTSITSSVDTQRVEITGPQDPGINFTTKNLPFKIIDGGVGPSAADNYANYAPFTNITGLVPGEAYIFRIVSIVAALESPGAPPDAQIIFIPGSALPPPFLQDEPDITPTSTTNTLYWDNGGVTDATLECRIIASTTDLYSDPLGEPVGGVGGLGDSGWEDCPDPLVTYEYEFTGLTPGTTYYYHVQSRSAVDGLSPFSNVEDSQQRPPTPIPPPADDEEPGDGPGGGGGIIPGTCGNGILDPVEECDDGNTDDGDGCSASCQDEEAAVSPVAVVCGNGIVEPPEECDDGNTDNDDGCSSVCVVEPEHAVAPAIAAVCGNGTVEAPEECDDGNTDSGDGCSDTCLIEETVCGNAIVEAPTEECDDGNTTSNDGCSDTCQLEEIVEVVLEIRGAPQYRVTNFKRMAEESMVNESLLDLTKTSLIAQTDTTSPAALTPTAGQTDTRTTTITTQELAVGVDADPADIYRIYNTPNRGLNAQLGIYKPIITNLDVISIQLDNFGNASIPITIVAGTYDFALNGEAHNATIMRDKKITSETKVLTLDFTFKDTVFQVAGDNVDDNRVNALDMSRILGSYKSKGINISDFNKDLNPIVNALDIAILIWNYKMEGQYLIPREVVIPREVAI
ncbi:DUF4215 domain-containing protein [Patescibacteria group bacterium]